MRASSPLLFVMVVALSACAAHGERGQPPTEPSSPPESFDTTRVDGEIVPPAPDAPELASGGTSPAPAAPSPSASVAPPTTPPEEIASDKENAECEEVCGALEKCTKKALPECRKRCLASRQVPTHETRCLALRVKWIDEAGCKKMIETYESFDPADDCGH